MHANGRSRVARAKLGGRVAPAEETLRWPCSCFCFCFASTRREQGRLVRRGPDSEDLGADDVLRLDGIGHLGLHGRFPARRNGSSGPRVTYSAVRESRWWAEGRRLRRGGRGREGRQGRSLAPLPRDELRPWDPCRSLPPALRSCGRGAPTPWGRTARPGSVPPRSRERRRSSRPAGSRPPPPP